MTDLSLDFAGLLCSRLCHDLLSPVGAINNGLELLADEPDPMLRGEYMGLLADSARASADKLRFFRLAFGGSADQGGVTAAAEVRSALGALARSSRGVAFGWIADEAELGRGAARILLNLGLIALDALVRGGRLDICLERDEIAVRAEGPRLLLDAAIRATLEGAGTKPTSRTAGAALAHGLAGLERRRLIVSLTDGVLLLGASSAVADVAPGGYAGS